MSTTFDGQTVAEMTAFALADRAGCMTPDTGDSIGARFLQRVAEDVVEAVEEREGESADEIRDGLQYVGRDSEIADSAVPIYTGELWATFTDLGAWQQNVTEFGEITDMEQGAKVALYMIASALVSDLLSDLDSDEDEEDDEQPTDEG